MQPDVYFFVESIKGDGRLVRTRRDVAYSEFVALCREIIDSLGALLSRVREF